MWFKKLLAYRLTQDFPFDAQALEEALKAKPANKPDSQSLSSIGFVAPYGKKADAPVVHVVNNFYLVCLRQYERLLPGAVVADALAEKVEEIEEAHLRKVYKKEKDQIKDEIIQKLLPQAFIRKSSVYGVIHPAAKMIYVNTTSPNQAENLLSALRDALGTLPVRPVTSKIAPSATFTEWVSKGSAGQDFTVLTDCQMQDAGEEGGSISLKGQDLSADEIKALLEAGKFVNQIELAWKDKVSFVLNDKLHFSKIRFDDLLQDQASQDGGDDEAGEFSASLLLMISTLDEMLPVLFDCIGGQELPAGI